MPVLTFLQAIRQGLIEEMEEDPSVILLGEDIAQYGGAFKMTEGLLDRFGSDRVIDTPIAEGGIIGTGVGCAIMGFRPVVEMQFIDFISCGFSQMTNVVAKFHYRTGHSLPLVVRGPCGGGVGAGPFHSQNPEAYFLSTPGLKIVAPATPEDAKGLLKAAIRDNNPVLFLESKSLYRKLKQEVSSNQQVVPLGRAKIQKNGTDLTVITYGAMVQESLKAAAILQATDGIELEILDLRTLLPIDEVTIISSLKKTNKAMIVHEATQTGGPAGEIIARVVSTMFEFLDAPLLRVAAKDTPVPYSRTLEDAFRPQADEIVTQARWLVKY